MGIREERGQATVEWAGLVLLVALVLAGALALWRGREAERGRELGAAVAERITCAVGRGCATNGGSRLVPLRAEPALPGQATPPVAPLASPAPPARAAPRRLDGFGTKALKRAGRLGGAAAKRAWLVCLGYERWRLELERPRPTEALPLSDALGIANDCLNPYEFLMGD